MPPQTIEGNPSKSTPPEPMRFSEGVILVVVLLLIAGAVVLNLPEPAKKVNLGPGLMDLEFGPDDGTYMQYDAADKSDVIGIETPYQVELVQVGEGRYELRFSETGVRGQGSGVSKEPTGPGY